jgi:hypothetical protein
LNDEGYLKCVFRANAWAVSYVPSGVRTKIGSGEIEVVGRDPDDGPVRLERKIDLTRAKTVWKRARHDAGWHGSRLGPARFATLTGISPRAAAHLTDGRRARPTKIRRVLAAFNGPSGDAQALARLIDAANTTRARCAYGECEQPSIGGGRYCGPEHARLARQADDRDRKRRTRAAQ